MFSSNCRSGIWQWLVVGVYSLPCTNFKVATGPRCGINRKIREVLQVPPWRSWGSGHINHLLPLLSLEGLEGFAERQLGCGAPGLNAQRSSPGLAFRVTMAPHLVGYSGWQIVVMTAGRLRPQAPAPRNLADPKGPLFVKPPS